MRTFLLHNGYVSIQDYLTVVQVARELGITEGAVRHAIGRGTLKHEEALGRKVILRSEVEAYRLRTQPGGEKLRGRPPKSSDTTSESSGI